MQTTYMLQKCDRGSFNTHVWLQSRRLKTHVYWEDEVALLLYTEINVRVQKILNKKARREEEKNNAEIYYIKR